MYAPRGFLADGAELGDIEVVASGETLHLFHLVLPNHDLVAHLVSDDGLAWRPRPPALRTGDPGAPDDDMIWTVGIAEHDGLWHMLYTALSRAEGGRVQRIALATSGDLERWDKAGGVAFESDARWYDADPAGWPWVSWRDPKPVWTGQEWLAPVCARGRSGPPLRRGVVGLARSEDLRRWEVQQPLLDPRLGFDVECPQLFRIGERWYLIASVLDDRSQRYWIADDPRGPWRTPPTDRLAPQGHYAARLLRRGDRVALLCWHDAADAAPGRTAKRAILSPLAVEAADDGRLVCTAWPEWRRYEQGGPQAVTPSTQGAFGHPEARASTQGGGLEGAADAGAEAWELAQPPGGYRFECRLALAAARGGIACGVAGGCGVFVQLEPAEHRIRLVARREARRPDAPAGRWLERQVLQQAPLSWSGEVALALRLVDGELEVTVDGEVRLSTLVEQAEGPVAAFVEGGRIALTDARWVSLASPAGG